MEKLSDSALWMAFLCFFSLNFLTLFSFPFYLKFLTSFSNFREVSINGSSDGFMSQLFRLSLHDVVPSFIVVTNFSVKNVFHTFKSFPVFVFNTSVSSCQRIDLFWLASSVELRFAPVLHLRKQVLYHRVLFLFSNLFTFRKI